jgi:hypothetical protein
MSVNRHRGEVRISDFVAIVPTVDMMEIGRQLWVWVILRAFRWHCEAVGIAPSIFFPQREADRAGNEFP